MDDVLTTFENKGINKGRAEGRAEGQNELVKAVELIRNGESDAAILEKGIDQHTLDLAKIIR